MRPRVRWHDRRNESSSGSALRLVRTSSARLRRNRWNGSSNESGTLREGPRASASRRQWKNWPPICGAGAAISLLRNARGADSPHALGPTATAGRSVAPMENPTAPPRGTHRKWGLRVGCKEHGRQRPRSLVSRPQQSSLYWALKCILQIARPAILVPIVLAELLEPPCTDPYARWCGRGGAARLPPIPILDPDRTSGMSQLNARRAISRRIVLSYIRCQFGQ